MTIRPGEAWGTPVERPSDLRIATSDAELARLLTDGSGAPTAVAAGDLARTLGTPRVETATELRAAPLDLVEVRIDGSHPTTAVAHVVARPLRVRGGWWRGPVVVVMNAEFMGDWDVAPRGHPNDGRVETFETVPGFGFRQRLACARRLPSATHVPHPGIRTRSVRTADWTFDRPAEVIVDGRRIGRGHRLEVHVLADAAVLYT